MAKKNMTPAQLRNLPQYRNLSEDELDLVVEQLQHGNFEDKVARVLQSFKHDYDLSNMSINDHISLEGLARLFVMIEETDKQIEDEINNDQTDWGMVGSMNRTAAKFREDASRMQNDLAITRKARQGDEGQNVVDFLEDLKSRAKKFLADRLAEIYCPKCNMLLAKVWFLYPNEENVVHLECGRDGCGYKFDVTSKFLSENGNKNVEVGPPIK